MLALMLKMNPRFTPEDRVACAPLIERILEFARLTRSQGLLALEAAVDQEPDGFMKESVEAIVDGWKSDDVRNLMSYMILSSGVTGAELLGKFILAEGLLAVQQQLRPHVIGIMLGVMLGGGYLSRKRAETET